MTLKGRAVAHPASVGRARPRASASCPRTARRRASCWACPCERNVALPNTRRLSAWGVVRAGARGRAWPGAGSPTCASRRRASASPRASSPAGTSRRSCSAKWLAASVDVLIVDEPTRGIDVPAKIEIYELMNRLTAEGKGILMISSELPEVLGMSDRVLVMRGGRVVAELESTRTTQAEVLAFALGPGQS